MISSKVVELCKNGHSVSAELAKDPSQEVSHICKKLFDTDGDHDTIKDKFHHMNELSSSDLEQAAECGNWGPSKPSELFLKVCACALLPAYEKLMS